MLPFRNKKLDDDLDRTYFDHLGPQGEKEYHPVSSEKKWVAWGAIAACLLFHGGVPNFLLFLMVVAALCIIIRG